MAPPCFTEWTVLPHKELQKLEDNLWMVHGTLPKPGMQRSMTLARRRDGRLVIHNAIALEEPLMKEIEAWGTPAFIVVPNAHHRQDCLIWKKRYPQAKVVCPHGIEKAVAKCVPVDLYSHDVPADPDVELVELDGMARREGLLSVRSADRRTLVSADVLCNVHGAKGFTRFFLGPTDCLSVPRFARLVLAKDTRALKRHLEKLAAEPGLERILVCHGKDVLTGAAGALRDAAARL